MHSRVDCVWDASPASTPLKRCCFQQSLSLFSLLLTSKTSSQHAANPPNSCKLGLQPRAATPGASFLIDDVPADEMGFNSGFCFPQWFLLNVTELSRPSYRHSAERNGPPIEAMLPVEVRHRGNWVQKGTLIDVPLIFGVWPVAQIRDVTGAASRSNSRLLCSTASNSHQPGANAMRNHMLIMRHGVPLHFSFDQLYVSPTKSYCDAADSHI